MNEGQAASTAAHQWTPEQKKCIAQVYSLLREWWREQNLAGEMQAQGQRPSCETAQDTYAMTMRAFTHYWSNETWAAYRATAVTGELLDHAASNLFVRRGVRAGDSLYIVTVQLGALYLLTKLHVAKVCAVDEVAVELGTTPELLWPAQDHVVAAASAPLAFDLPVPLDVVKQLRFHSGGQAHALKFRAACRLDQQTLRGVRALTSDAARLLDQLLPPLAPLNLVYRRWQQIALPEEVAPPGEQTYWEGAVIQVTVNAYERNTSARQACIAHWGTSCVVCGFDFAAVYGPAAQGLIPVHHLRPLAAIGAAYALDPVADLRPVCANCHAVLHWRTDTPYPIETVRAWLDAPKASPDV